MSLGTPFQLIQIQLAGHRWNLGPALTVVRHDVTIGKHGDQAVVRVRDGRNDIAMADEVFYLCRVDLPDHAAAWRKD